MEARIKIYRWQTPRRLLSLVEMIQFFAKHVYEAIESLSYWKETAESRIGSQPVGSTKRNNGLRGLMKDIERVNQNARELELPGVRDRCRQFLADVQFALPNEAFNGTIFQAKISTEVILREIDGIVFSFWHDLEDRHFAFIPPSKEVFFENTALMGDAVSEAFPSVREDIKDAGNCLASGLNTAAVSHLMAAVNAAILVLARHLKVKLKNLEYHDWKPILTGVSLQLEKAHGLKRGPKKQREVEFYADILGEMSALKDVHRNNVSHYKKRYSETEALGVYERVKSLMQRLATRLKE